MITPIPFITAKTGCYLKLQFELERGNMEKQNKSPSTRSPRTPNVMIIGESFVGKTAIFQRAVDPHWKFTLEMNATIAISKPVVKRTSKGPLKLWDCGGQERFKNITLAFLKQADACIIVASLDNTTSFDSAARWMNDIHRFVENKQKEPIPVIFVVNKIDLDGKNEFVMKDWKLQEEKIANQYDVPHFSVSALLNTGIEEMLESVASCHQEMKGKRKSQRKFLRRKSSSAASRKCHRRSSSVVINDQKMICCVVS